MGRTSSAFMLSMAFALLCGALGPTSTARADMGRVYVSSDDVTVTEDAQKAIILHNLSEEVLILGTELKASEKTGIVRFIPFPSEPTIALAPDGAFEKAVSMIRKYGLKYQQYAYTKGGPSTSTLEGVEIRLKKKLGAHDMTLIKVNDASAFRKWVNEFFAAKGLPVKESYPREEAVVNDYVKRGLCWFAVDYVEVPLTARFIEPVAYRFKTRDLYYPLKTSNTFGGQGTIELIIISPFTLCAPGNEPMDPYSGALYKEEHPGAKRPYGQRPFCLNLPVKASTSALLVKTEKDLDGIYPGGEAFFEGKDVIIQVVNYTGPYRFTDDILVDVSTGLPRAAGVVREEQGNPWDGKFPFADAAAAGKCGQKPDPGPCKGMFERYYFDAAAGSCKKFFWGGCDGVVPFETEDECKTCLGSLKKGAGGQKSTQEAGKALGPKGISSAEQADNAPNLFDLVIEGRLDRVKAAVERGADVNMRDVSGKTPVIYASDGKAGILKYLASKGADVNLKDNDGRTALMNAVESNDKTRPAVVAALLELRADPDAANAKGETALILAAKKGDTAVVKALLDRGARFSAQDREGKTAWTYAFQNGNDRITALLEKKGAARAFAGAEWEGKVSHIMNVFIKAITSREEWVRLWKIGFEKKAPEVDFERYAVACVFLGHSASWLYSIDFGTPEERGGRLVIPYTMAELMLELSGPFKAGGQYCMMVVEKRKGLPMVLEDMTDYRKLQQ